MSPSTAKHALSPPPSTVSRPCVQGEFRTRRATQRADLFTSAALFPVTRRLATTHSLHIRDIDWCATP